MIKAFVIVFFLCVGQATAALTTFGVGRNSSGQWAVMVSTHFYVTVSHWHPSVGSTLIFTSGTATVVQSWPILVETNPQYPYSDVELGMIDAEMPYYMVSGYSDMNWYTNRQVLLFGKNGRSGTNTVLWVSQMTPYYWWMATTGEFVGITGDSGGPSFLIVKDQYVLAGNHHGVGTATYDNWIPAQSQRINAIMSQYGEALTLAYVPVAGDINMDGKVDLQDFGILKNHYGESGENINWSQGDLNGDHMVDLQDFGILKDNYGFTQQLAPESSTFFLCALGLLCGCREGRRRKDRSPGLFGFGA